MEKEFKVGDVVWAKVQGYPWWPGMVSELPNKINENKYKIDFINDTTHSYLNIKDISDYFQNYSKNAKIKNNALKLSIEKANDILAKRKTQEESATEINTTSTNTNTQIEKISIKEDLTKKKRKRNSVKSSNVSYSNLTSLKEKSEIEIIKKVICYLIYIAKTLEKEEYEVVDQETSCFMKVLEYLKDFRMIDPIDFLKKTNIGKLIKYISSHFPDGENNDNNELKDLIIVVYHNLEEQLSSQLFQKNK